MQLLDNLLALMMFVLLVDNKEKMDTRTEKRKESMKKKKQLIFMLFFSHKYFFTVGYIILPRIRVKIEQEKCDKIYANKILKLPDKEKANVGFTCTGLYWDKEEESFL